MANPKIDDVVKLEGVVVQFKKTGRRILYTISIPIRKHDVDSPEKKLEFIDHDIYLTDLKRGVKKSGKTKSGGKKSPARRRKRKEGGAS